MHCTDFDGLTLLTAPHRVMTPQPASTQLVVVAAAHLGRRRAAVADVGTGSGALAIAIATRCPNTEVWATDTSRSACVLAEANVRRHGLDDRVFVRQGDLLAPVPRRFDLIVANLPYLAADTAATHPELADQPFAAVFGAGDGLDPYRRLLASVRDRLTDSGLLVVQLHRRVVVARPSDVLGVTCSERPAHSPSATRAAVPKRSAGNSAATEYGRPSALLPAQPVNEPAR